MSLRPQDPVPDWVTHLALVRDGRVTTGPKDDVLNTSSVNTSPPLEHHSYALGSTSKPPVLERPAAGNNLKTLVEMRNVNVQYDNRKVFLS